MRASASPGVAAGLTGQHMYMVQYMATYGVAHVHRGALDYRMYDPAMPRGLVSIPVSTCIGFRVLLRSYSWYVYTDSLSIVLIQMTVEAETHHCRTNRREPLSTSFSDRMLSPSQPFLHLNNSSSCRIHLGKSSGLSSPYRFHSMLRHPLPTRESIYHGGDAVMTK